MARADPRNLLGPHEREEPSCPIAGNTVATSTSFRTVQPVQDLPLARTMWTSPDATSARVARLSTWSAPATSVWSADSAGGSAVATRWQHPARSDDHARGATTRRGVRASTRRLLRLDGQGRPRPGRGLPSLDRDSLEALHLLSPRRGPRSSPCRQSPSRRRARQHALSEVRGYREETVAVPDEGRYIAADSLTLSNPRTVASTS